MSENRGVLPGQRIHAFCEAGYITHAKPSSVSGASLDLHDTDEIYEVDRVALPQEGECVQDLLTLMGANGRHDISRPLKAGRKYIAKLSEEIDLPKGFYGYTNPKSSTGRVDVHARIIADRMPRYDSIEAGFHGKLWIVIEPKSFGIRIPPGYSFAQARFFNGNTRFSDIDLLTNISTEKLVWCPDEKRPLAYEEIPRHDKDGSIMLTLDIPVEGVVGYRCIATPEDVLNLEHRDVDPYRFFTPIYTDSGVVNLFKDNFYILSVRESVRIPPGYAGEMVSMDDRSGEFRSHYAGYLDPGWGYGKDGEGEGAPFTLEVRPFENLVIRMGQPIAKIRLERMIEPPVKEFLYAARGNASYQVQTAAKLAKQFAPFSPPKS